MLVWLAGRLAHHGAGKGMFVKASRVCTKNIDSQSGYSLHFDYLVKKSDWERQDPERRKLFTTVDDQDHSIFPFVSAIKDVVHSHSI